MENRSNNILVGGVILALLAISLAFIVWLAGFKGGNEKSYDIFFKQSVDGLAKGSPVTFSGVPSGKVDEIELMPQSPDFVRVRIKVNPDLPVLEGTTATIASIGFTGVSQINLDGAIKGAPMITCPEINPRASCPKGVPVIPTKPGPLGELLNSAPLLIERLATLTERLTETLSPDNQKSITGILNNTNRLTSALADRGPEIAATIAESRDTLRKAGEAAEKLGALAATTDGLVQQEVKPMMANLNTSLASADRSMKALETTLNEAKPGVQGFTKDTLPEINRLMRDLSAMSQALSSVANRLDSQGAGALLSPPALPDYKPRD